MERQSFDNSAPPNVILPNPGQIQAAFRALSDPTRRDILRLLANQDMTIGDVSDQFDITRGAVKKHLTILEEGALISVRTNGRERINKLEANGLKTATDWLSFFSQFWDQKLAALQDAVAAEETAQKIKK
jgi:DNA-binding transcriptional ArsR family regulator